MKLLIFFCLFLISSISYANSYYEFMNSFKEELHLLKMGRVLELDNHVKIRPFNILDKALSPDASATYNGKLNLIKLNDHLIRKVGNKFSAKSLLEMENHYEIATIFHEIGHAEVDIFIENRKNSNDEILMSYYKYNLKPAIKRNFSVNAWTFFHEYFGYYRTDLVEIITMDKLDIYHYNGYSKLSKKCYLPKWLEQKLKSGVSREEFLKIFPLEASKSYRIKAAPRYIFVKRKDYDLEKVSASDKSIFNLFNNLIWQYHIDEFGFPSTQGQLVDRMNNNDIELKNIQQCRNQYFDSYYN